MSSSRSSCSSPPAISRAAGRVEQKGRAFDLGEERCDAGLPGGAFGFRQRRARRLDPQAPHGDAGDDQFVGRA